ncbi:unnamed protein product, partial [Dibothriocephalus latus]
MASGQPQQQQQQAFLPNQIGTPAAPAFAVIAPDSAALQALLSGNVSGRAFIIQPLNMSPYAAPTQLPSEVSGLSASFTHLPSSSLQHPETVTHVQNLALPQATISLPNSLRNSPNPGMTAVDASVQQQQPLQPPPPPPPPQIHTGYLVTPQPHRAALTAVQQPQLSAPTSQSQDVGDN